MCYSSCFLCCKSLSGHNFHSPSLPVSCLILVLCGNLLNFLSVTSSFPPSLPRSFLSSPKPVNNTHSITSSSSLRLCAVSSSLLTYLSVSFSSNIYLQPLMFFYSSSKPLHYIHASPPSPLLYLPVLLHPYLP